VTVPTA